MMKITCLNYLIAGLFAVTMSGQNYTIEEQLEIDTALNSSSAITRESNHKVEQNRNVLADFTPTAGTTETFILTMGDFFFDPGGPGGSEMFNNEPGNYPNCGCMTTTTLNGVDEITFNAFNVNAIFDFLIIYDGSNTTAPVLYDNSTGGANEGDITLDDMIASNGSAVFNASGGVLTFFFNATTAINRLGWEAEVTESSTIVTPPNDLCENAVQVDCGSIVSGTTNNATLDTDVAGDICGTDITAPGVWYEFTDSSGVPATVTASLCNGTDYDTKISVFEGNCDALICIAGNDDDCATQSIISWNSDGVSTYYVLVHGFLDLTGNFGLEISCMPISTPPTNDFCEDAIAIDCGASVTGTTVGATLDNDVAGDTCGTTITSPGVWYSFTDSSGAPATVTATLCNGTDFDSKISVFDGDCTSLVCIDGNDDDCGVQSTISWNSDGVSTYYILVHSFGSASGNFGLDISCTPGGAPSNGLCEGAIPIDCDTSLTGTTIDATIDQDDTGTNCGTLISSPGVWYAFTDSSGEPATITATTCANSNFDTKISIFEGDCDALICIDGNDDDCGVQSTISWESDGTTTYYILIHAFGGNTGNFSLDVTCVPTLGIDDVVIDGFTYYPNPVEDVLSLNANTTIDSIDIYNLLGQLVVSERIDATSSQVDVSAMASGSYIMKVSSNGVTGTYSVIKR